MADERTPGEGLLGTARADALLDLFERGDRAFVDVLHDMTDPDFLAAFAGRWCTDGRPVARELLLAYLDTPLNAFHEPLVSALLARAESAGDDTLMGCFLVLFDRSVRRELRNRETNGADGEKAWVTCAANVPPLQRIGSVWIWPGFNGRDRVLHLTEQQGRDYEPGRLFGVSRRRGYFRRVWGYFRIPGRPDPMQLLWARRKGPEVSRLSPARDAVPDAPAPVVPPRTASCAEAVPVLKARALRDLNRGGPAAPRAVRDILERLGWYPEEMPQWLPVLGAALRCVRGPAWREALAAVVGWGERHPEERERLRGMVPELNWCEAAVGGGP